MTEPSLITSELIKAARLFPYPDSSTEEHCGIVLLSGTLKTLKNIHKNPSEHYRMDLRRYKGKFKAIFHTHLKIDEDEPSWHDLKQIRSLRETLPTMMGIVLNVPLGLLVEYDGDGPVKRVLINT